MERTIQSKKASYEQIMAQDGMQSFKGLIKKWEALSRNMAEVPGDVPFILPDILLVSGSGTGRTHLLKQLADYLSERENLMDFYGDVKYFEFMLNYCTPSEHFSEIQRFMAEVDNAAGFRSEYRGIVYVDVDEWCDHFEEKHFINFMEYLSDNSDEWLVVLSVSDKRGAKIERMESVISAFLRIERVNIEMPGSAELMAYMKRILASYRMTLSPDGERLLTDSISVLLKNKYFDFYKTVRMLCKDIAYSAYISGKKGQIVLNAEDLQEYSVDGAYIARTVMKIEKSRRIGF